MSHRVLGIDGGTGSTGWAILNMALGEISDVGVITFPEGMDPNASSSVDTKAAERREKRSARRRIYRKKGRRFSILGVLVEYGKCPLPAGELKEWKNRGKFPENMEFRRWLSSSNEENPYVDRAAAVSGKVDDMTFGRALYHLNQRRGFKSNRKDKTAEDKNLGAVKEGIKKLAEEMSSSGSVTMGQYFCGILEREKDSDLKTRIRGRFLDRIKVEEEFSLMMDVQGYPEGDEFREKMHKAMFSQRPLRSQRHLVGKCPLEPRNSKARSGHPDFEKFRMLSFVNNIRIVGKDGEDVDVFDSITQNDRDRICLEIMKKSRTFRFKDIEKIFRNDPRFKVKGLKFNYSSDYEVKPCRTSKILNECFGDLNPDKVDEVFNALDTFTDEDKLFGWFVEHYPEIGEKSAKILSEFNPEDSFASYSLKAIRKINRFLEKGYDLRNAIVLAKFPDVIPGYDEREGEILGRINEIVFEYRTAIANYRKMGLYERKMIERPSFGNMLKNYLLENFGIGEDGWNRLYLNGSSSLETIGEDGIPPVDLKNVRNPMAISSMNNVIKIINRLLSEGKIDQSDTIVIETAREVNGFSEKRAIQKIQNKKKEDNDKARAELEKLGIQPTDFNVQKYVLWEEQGGVCCYTGNKISKEDLFSNGKYDIEHTVPVSRSGDDSLSNKTICDSNFNRNVKKNTLPTDLPNWSAISGRLSWIRDEISNKEKDFEKKKKAFRSSSDPGEKSKAKEKFLVAKEELSYWRKKLSMFEMTEERLGEGGFMNRQLSDTGIITKYLVQHLKRFFRNVYSVKGSATAFARKAWGLQEDPVKDRSDHTHHAVDAMVIASLTPRIFKDICTSIKGNGISSSWKQFRCPQPWDGFSDQVKAKKEEILVKNLYRRSPLRQGSKGKGDCVRGQLHKDTFYGKIVEPGTKTLRTVIRKPLEGKVDDLLKMSKDIVDPALRKTVAEQLEVLKGEKIDGKEITSIPSGKITTKKGIPIRKIRIFSRENPKELKNHDIPSKKGYKTPYYVSSGKGSNFRMGVFETGGKRHVEDENLLLWAKNHKRDDYSEMRSREGFLGYFRPGMMVLTKKDGESPSQVCSLPKEEISKRLYKLVNFDKDRMILIYHREARSISDLKEYLSSTYKTINGNHVLGKDGNPMTFNVQGESSVDFENPHKLLRLNKNFFIDGILIEGIDFKIDLKGEIFPCKG